jgi:predicted RNase H-like nuclease (RuvC/YqgF family)
LAEDKKHLQEVLDRYNKDKKDKDGKVKEGEELLEFEFNSEGIITNYKQTVGAMAEELAAFYRDGELTAEEGKKAEELQKKIADLNVVIQDYEDSLTQLQTSIDTYE